MALTLGQGAQLVASPSFQARVRMAMVRAAVAVSNETQGTLSPTAWAKRQQLATRILTSPDSMLPAFVAAVASDPGLSLSWYTPVRIASSTNANPTVITTSAVHGLASGDVVEILDHLVNTAANGTWVATVLSTTTFSIPQSANGVGGATGTMQKMETDTAINFTVNSTVPTNIFSAIAGLTHEDRAIVVLAMGASETSATVEPSDDDASDNIAAPSRFTPFKNPTEPGDRPLVTHAGSYYVCSGCGGAVADGLWIHENVRDGMVVGLWMQAGPDAPPVHQCGEVNLHG